MGDFMKEAAFSLAEAKFATGDFNQVVLQNVTKAQIKVRSKKDNVAGIFIQFFCFVKPNAQIDIFLMIRCQSTGV